MLIIGTSVSEEERGNMETLLSVQFSVNLRLLKKIKSVRRKETKTNSEMDRLSPSSHRQLWMPGVGGAQAETRDLYGGLMNVCFLIPTPQSASLLPWGQKTKWWGHSVPVEGVPPRYVALVCRLLWAEGTWETRRRKGSLPFGFYLKARHEISHNEGAHLHQRENILVTRDWASMLK